MSDSPHISDNSRRIARNTVLLYFRMLLILCIGLFTSRVVLEQLGIEDYGIWNAVGGVVTSFTFVTAAIAGAISRFLAYEIGVGDKERLKRVFATSVVVQIALSVLLVLLVETLGMWLLDKHLNIPLGRESVARTVLHCSLGILVINMMSVPYNAVIIAHEKMGAFALISIVEAVLKVSVALLLCLRAVDKLNLYAFLMVGVSLVVRLCYAMYSRRHFEESRAKLMLDKDLLKQMTGFAGWSFIGESAGVLNIQGLSVLMNMFFGVLVNASRGVAMQVEGIVKQFATNFLLALNPQITKSWASGNKEYCFELVSKGAKFTFLILLLFIIPIWYEADLLLGLWLKEVPHYAAVFTRATLFVLLIEMSGNTLLTLQLATGKVRKYFVFTGLTSLMCLPCVWLSFSQGARALDAYLILIAISLIVFVLKLLIVSKQTGLGAWKFVRDVVFKLLIVSILSWVLPSFWIHHIEDGILRVLVVCASAWAIIAISSWLLLLTKGEKQWILSKLPFKGGSR